MPAAYPTAADLTAYMASVGVTVDATQAAQAIAAGIAAFESAVGRKMLAGSSETRTFDPPSDGLLDLAADLAAAPTVTYTPLGGSPETFAVLTDYRLEPQNALAQGKLIERILFRRRWWSPYSFDQVESIGVTGPWGYGTTIPDDAWQAMLVAAGLTLSDTQTVSSGGALTAWREGNSSATYAVSGGGAQPSSPQQFVAGVASRYTKVVLG